MQGNTVKLITEGRVTGLPHIVEVRFAFIDGAFYALAGGAKTDWVRNALRKGKAKLRTQELVFNVAPEIASDQQKATVLNAFTSKYGSRIVNDWYINSAICLRLRPTGEPTRRGALRGEGEATTTFREWLKQNKDYYQGIALAFDSASEEYDFTISHNYINTWIRKRSIRELLRYVTPDATVLEVGCGTGAEAIEISSHVSKIVATDISDRMIQILLKKAEARGLKEKITAIRLNASEISKVAELSGNGEVDLAYSFNGALNCEPRLEEFVNGISSVLVPGGYFVCSIRNSFCFSEALSHLAVLQFKKMAPRKKQPVMVSVGGLDVPSFYYPPTVFIEFFAKKFRLRKLIGLPAFLPPAYLSDYYVKFKNIASVLEKLELTFGRRFPFNRMGDQTLFVFQARQ
jgi:ubiquinone/menaquinone biosynthesis C-methylase UbiE